MKRIISWAITVMMLIGMLGSFSVQFAFATETDEYAPLVTVGSAVYANTMVVNKNWTDSQLSTGTQLSYWFRGETYTETYDANRHFNSFAKAQTAFHSKLSGTALATTVPNYILLGEFKEVIDIKYSANLYGANAGISPNDPNFNPATAAPDATWGTNSAWSTANETVIAYIATYGFMWQHTNDQQQIIKDAGGNATVNIDGLSYKQGSGTQLPNDGLWFINGGDYKITFTANIKNTVMQTRYGIVGLSDTGTNFYDVNLQNVRASEVWYKFFWRRVRNVTIDHCLFDDVSTSKQNATAMLWEPGDASLTVNGVQTYGDYISQGAGGDRSVSWTVTNSMFSNNNSTNQNYLAKFTDNCYHSAIKFKFENNLFQNASTATDGMIMFGAYPNASNPTPEIVMKNNTFYDNKGNKQSLITATAETLMAAYDLEFTGNRVIGFDSIFPAFTANMSEFLGNCEWNVNNNYFSQTYSSAEDKTGEISGWLESTSATTLPVDVTKSVWYSDYKMTKQIKVLELGTPAFENDVTGYSVDHTSKTAFASLKTSTGIQNFTFNVINDDETVKVYSNAELTNEITSVTEAEIKENGGRKDFYVVVSDENSSVTYTITISAMQAESITEWHDATGTIKDGFGVLVPSDTTATTVEFVWQGGYYSAEVGVNAYKTVASARSAGIKQLIMPALNYGEVEINGSIELYGNHFGKNPNTIPEDRTQDWTKNTEWNNYVTTVGNIKVPDSATPTSVNGTQIVIDGLKLDGYFLDNVRGVTKYATNIKMTNILFAFSKTVSGAHHVIDLETELARATTDEVVNSDTFIVENSRFDFVASNSNTRIFDEDSPRTLIVNNNYFAKDHARLGWFKQQLNVTEGHLELSNNYFRESGNIIHITGGVTYYDGDSSKINSITKFNNNIVYNSTVEGSVIINPAVFKHTEISGNVFIDTKNLHKHPISLYEYNESLKGVDYSNVLTFKGNRFIGVSDHLMLNEGTVSLAADNANYYAVYTEDFANGQGDGKMYGALENSDYYLDFNATTLASDAAMKADREGMTVVAKSNAASIVIAKDETYVPALKTVKDVPFTLYSDKEYKNAVSSITADSVGDGKVYYAKAVTETGVVIEYKVVISAGNANAPKYEGAYLLYDKTEDMPVGTKFVATYKGNEYTFTAGVDAFPSLAQISVQHKKDEQINVIMLSGAYEGGYNVTGNFNIVGDNTVLKNGFKTDGPVKIACVGDSITEAVMDGGRATWGYPARLNDFLDAQYGEGNYAVKNFGKGNSSLQEINTTTTTNMQTASRSQYKQGSWYYSALNYNPDVVMIMIGHNDTQVSETDHIYKSAANYKQHYIDLIESFKALPSNPQVIIVSCHSRSDTFRKNLIEKCIIPVQKELAERYNTIFVDTYTMTDNMKNAADGVYSSDNLHLTPKGYALLAGLIKDNTDGIYSANRNVTLDGVTVDENATVVTKPAKIKVAVIGDDTVYGAKSYVNYPTALGEILGDGYEVRNYGECGSSPKQYLSNEYGDISDYASMLEWKPDVAIISFGVNNAKANDNFNNKYIEIIEAVKATGATVYLATSTRNSVNDAVKTLAATNNLGVVDIYTLATELGSTYKVAGETYFFNEKGAQKVAEYIAKELFDITALTTEKPVLTGDQFHDVSTTIVPVTDAPLFTERDDSDLVIKNDAVAVVETAAQKTSGDSFIARWDGQYYKFIVGVNVFGTLADALATDAKQIIVPAGIIRSFEVTRSVEIYGADYNTEPWTLDGEKVVRAADWSRYGESIIYKTDIVIANSAVGADILISGFRMTRGFNDTARPLSQTKTSITLKNNILDRAFEKGDFREFNLHNANNVNFTDTSVENNDEFTIKNMLYENHGANTQHALFQEQVPSYFTIDGFGCNIDMTTFGFPKWGVGTKKGKMTITNSFFKDNSDPSSRFAYVANLSGHSSNANLTDEQVASLDLTLEVSNNNFIDCYDGGTEGAIVIWPAAYTNIIVDGNTFVCSADRNVRAIQWRGDATFRPNDKDFTDRITFKNNRIIGSLATNYVNDLTKIDLSNNYFETYTLSFRNGVTGDIPADIDANYYLDYKLTTTIGDMAPVSADGIAALTTNSTTRTIYGYATKNIEALNMSNSNGVEYTFYSDADCKTAITSLDVELGSASKAYVKAKRGNIELVYGLYVMGIKDEADITSPDMNKTLEGIDDATLYYPSLYGAPNGIEVISYYDGMPVKFTTGKDVAASSGEMGLYGDDIIFPDDITEVDGLELVTAVNVYSAVANFKGIKMRKVKIACVGDSITDGVINGGRQDSYPTTMQNLLGTASYDIQNFGGSGATAQYIERLRLNATAGDRERHYKVLRKSMYDGSIAYNGDVVIIGLGANDAGINEPVRWLSNDNFINSYVELIREYQALPSKPAIYLTTTTARYDQAVATVMIQENMRYIEQAIADMTGAKVIDLNSLMDYMFASTATEYSTDKLHPTAKGYHEMGQIIADEVTKTFAPIGENTTTVNGGTVTGVIESSVKNTELALNDNTLILDSQIVKGDNFKRVALHNSVATVNSKVVSEFDAAQLVTTGGTDKIDLGAADVDAFYGANPEIAVSNNNPNVLLQAVQAQNEGVGGFDCPGITDLMTVDTTTLTEQEAKNAIIAIRTGTHVLIDVTEKAPDCENIGYNAHKACAHCDYKEGYVPVDADGHKPEKQNGKSADCLTDGYKDYYFCDVCDKYFADDKATIAIADIEAWKKADGKLSSEGHKWGEYVYNNDATTEADGTKTRECSVCHEKETVTAEGTMITVVIQDTSKIFKDVKKGWYKDAVDYAYSYGFIAGMSDTEFGLNTNVTRGMFITILARIAGVDTTTKGVNNVTTKFTDVKSGKWYAAAIKWASDNGIVSGTSDTTFGPDVNISRQDLCVMVVNYAKFMNVELTAVEDEITFKDAKDIRKYAKDAVKVCQMADIVNGYTDGTFGPTKTATRAEAAVILYKLHANFMVK